MISFFREWALGVCFASLTSAIIYAISPNGAIRKSIRVVIAIVVICSITFPFAQKGFDIDFDLQNDPVNNTVYSDELESMVKYQITATYADEITAKTDYILSSAGMKECKITLMTDINDEGSIFIKKAYIKLPDITKTLDEKTRKELSELFGKETITVFN